MGVRRTLHALPAVISLLAAGDSPSRNSDAGQESAFEKAQTQLQAAQETVLMQERLLELEREMRDLQSKLAGKDGSAPPAQRQLSQNNQTADTMLANSLAAGLSENEYESFGTTTGRRENMFTYWTLITDCVILAFVGVVAYVKKACWGLATGTKHGRRHVHISSKAQDFDEGKVGKRRSTDTPYLNGDDRQEQVPRNIENGPQRSYRITDAVQKPAKLSARTNQRFQPMRHKVSECDDSISRASTQGDSFDSHMKRGPGGLLRATQRQQVDEIGVDTNQLAQERHVNEVVFKQPDGTRRRMRTARVQSLEKNEHLETKLSWSRPEHRSQLIATTPPSGSHESSDVGDLHPLKMKVETEYDDKKRTQDTCPDTSLELPWLPPPPGLAPPLPAFALADPPVGLSRIQTTTVMWRQLPEPPSYPPPLPLAETEEELPNAAATTGASLSKCPAAATEIQARALEEALEEECDTTETEPDPDPDPETPPEEVLEIEPHEMEKHPEKRHDLDVDQEAAVQSTSAEEVADEDGDEDVVDDAAEDDEFQCGEPQIELDAKTEEVIPKRRRKRQQKQAIRQNGFWIAVAGSRFQKLIAKCFLGSFVRKFLDDWNQNMRVKFAEEPKPRENMETRKRMGKVKQGVQTKHRWKSQGAKNVDISSFWRTLKKLEDCHIVVVCVLIHIIILIGKIILSKNSDNVPDDPRNPCWEGTWPDPISMGLPVANPEYNFPHVTLYAPCLYKSYLEVASSYTASTSGWYFVHSPLAAKIVLTHRNEEGVPMPSGPQNKHLQDANIILQFMQRNIMPKMGILTDETYEFYMSWESGLIWVLPEPGTTIEDIDQKYRPVVQEVAQNFNDRYQFVFIDTQAYATMIESELGVTSFPRLVVQREAVVGRPFVYDGQFVIADMIEFIQDVNGNCFDFLPSDLRLGLSNEREPLNPVCDAGPVFRRAAT